MLPWRIFQGLVDAEGRIPPRVSLTRSCDLPSVSFFPPSRIMPLYGRPAAEQVVTQSRFPFSMVVQHSQLHLLLFLRPRDHGHTENTKREEEKEQSHGALGHGSL